ncbi:hypothetical protein [Calothrix rhizosoleniae]|uniref:hypothetical protein n=1 Tax=Calothrix rhizosoleniae TaxID=888997 RepID=UPI000B4A2D60|nr:hypothetical protein [Calothrix rhizosoleniae]
MARISIADIDLYASKENMDGLTYPEMTKIFGGRLTWEQLCAMDEKMYSWRMRQDSLMDNLSDQLDQQIYKDIMGWELPTNIQI